MLACLNEVNGHEKWEVESETEVEDTKEGCGHGDRGTKNRGRGQRSNALRNGGSKKKELDIRGRKKKEEKGRGRKVVVERKGRQREHNVKVKKA